MDHIPHGVIVVSFKNPFLKIVLAFSKFPYQRLIPDVFFPLLFPTLPLYVFFFLSLIGLSANGIYESHGENRPMNGFADPSVRQLQTTLDQFISDFREWQRKSDQDRADLRAKCASISRRVDEALRRIDLLTSAHFLARSAKEAVPNSTEEQKDDRIATEIAEFMELVSQDVRTDPVVSKTDQASEDGSSKHPGGKRQSAGKGAQDARQNYPTPSEETFTIPAESSRRIATRSTSQNNFMELPMRPARRFAKQSKRNSEKKSEDQAAETAPNSLTQAATPNANGDSMAWDETLPTVVDETRNAKGSAKSSAVGNMKDAASTPSGAPEPIEGAVSSTASPADAKGGSKSARSRTGRGRFGKRRLDSDGDNAAEPGAKRARAEEDGGNASSDSDAPASRVNASAPVNAPSNAAGGAAGGTTKPAPQVYRLPTGPNVIMRVSTKAKPQPASWSIWNLFS
jgi:hypothetical protein